MKNARLSTWTLGSSLLIALLAMVTACSEPAAPLQKLPYIGFHDVNGTDTTYHSIPSFRFVDQDSTVVGSQELSDYIYVSDFFYSYCPSICPKVKNQMMRIYEKFAEEKKLKLVSFALDPERDNVSHLHAYANNLEVESHRWHFLTGDRDQIWDLAEQYLISVWEDPEEPGGIYHSGKILLIDSKGHIRAFAKGTEEEAVTAFMGQIDLLLQEVKAGQL
ncbi:MAG: SCO family protein [Bacteroidota bacterium]